MAATSSAAPLAAAAAAAPAAEAAELSAFLAAAAWMAVDQGMSWDQLGNCFATEKQLRSDEKVRRDGLRLENILKLDSKLLTILFKH